MIDTDSWRVRRTYIKFTLLWCGATVTVITGFTVVTGRESSLLETIAIGVLTLFGSTLGSYVFGAAWDDQNKRRFGGRAGHRIETTRVEEVTPATPIDPVAPIAPEGP